MLTVAFYLFGCFVVLVLHGKDTGFYDPKKISPRPDRWYFKPWGRPIAVAIDLAIWPFMVAREGFGGYK